LAEISFVATGAIDPFSPGSVMAVTAKTATGTASAAAENSVLRVSIVHREFCWRIKKVLQQRNVSVQTLGHDWNDRR
jgi:mannitol-specific phosphotransferase system IIBC component